MSKVADSVLHGKRIQELNIKRLLLESMIHMDSNKVIKIEEDIIMCPLRMWNDSVQKLTLVDRERDIKPVYKELINRVN